MMMPPLVRVLSQSGPLLEEVELPDTVDVESLGQSAPPSFQARHFSQCHFLVPVGIPGCPPIPFLLGLLIEMFLDRHEQNEIIEP